MAKARSTVVAEWEEAERLYGEARDLMPDERAKRIEAACAGKAELRAEVLSLLEHADAAEAFFGRMQEHLRSDPSGPDDEVAGHPAAPTASPAPELAPGSVVGRYRIVEQIGAGGMGTVYRAHDPALDREVAVKLLPPHLALDPEARDRFLHEARAAAALDHLNICTIHEVREGEDGRLFLAMACYEGETLKARLARGPLALRDAVAWATQLARGLAAAHAQGIVHRDVKPGNVMITADGTVKLLDFGLAKMADVTFTRPGVTPGTVAYMSPEQVRGEGVDHRTDLFSLGVVLYEMLAGVRPFRGDRDRAVLNAILHEEPVPLGTVRPETPEPVAQAVDRLLRKDPGERYAGADELLAELEATPGAASGPDSPQLRAPGSSAVGTGRMRESHRVRRLAVVGATVALALIVLAAWFWIREPRPPPLHPQRVVVAPFENRTGDAALDPIGDIATDWIIQGLAQTPAVDVVPASAALASARYVRAGPGRAPEVDPIRALAVETGAGLVVSGAYYRHGDSLRFQAQITDARRRRVVWSLEPIGAPADAPMPALERLRQRTLGALAPVLDVRLAEAGRSYHGRPPSYEAYRAYAAGWDPFLRGAWREAIVQYERALAFDSTYLAPQLAMAWAYANLREFARTDSITSVLNRSRDRLTPYELASLDLLIAAAQEDRLATYEAARRSATLAPGTLPHVQWGVEALRLNRPREAIRILSAIDPTRGVVRGYFLYWTTLAGGRHLLGQHRRELRVARRARDLHPDEPRYLLLEAVALAALGRASEIDAVVDARMTLPEPRPPNPVAFMIRTALELRAHGHPEASLALFDRAIAWYEARPADERAPYRGDYATALNYVGRGHDAEAVYRELSAEYPENVGIVGVLGMYAAQCGDHAEAERIADRLAVHREPRLWGNHTFFRACIAAYLGRDDDAVSLLRDAFAQGASYWPRPHFMPCFESLRADPRYREMMQPKG